jgi:hypothetical protein
MRLPRVRVRTEVLMVAAVAVVLATALIASIVVAVRRRDHYQRTAIVHDRDSRRAADAALRIYRDGTGRDTRLSKADEEAVSRYWRIHLHHMELREKYEEAARYPLSAVAPDPPEPE